MRGIIFVLLCGCALAQTRPATSDGGGANLPAQKIKANDLIAVSVYDAPEFTRTVRVSADGTIRLPMLEQHIKADGLLPSELETAIATALKAEEILVNPAVTVTVAEYHHIRPISVMGAVKAPITFEAVGDVSLIEALTRAGGLGPEAGQEVLITRTQPGPDGKPVSLTQRVSVKALIGQADPEADLKLVGGEEIRVPEAGRVFVIGNVKTPGAFTFRDSGETTVLKALAMAQGLTSYSAKQAYIVRQDDRSGAKNEIPIELAKIMERKSPDVPLMANDILYVPDRSGRRATMQTLEKVLAFGAGAGTALIYTATVH
jgi:polysaccharide export outer membrane protein